MSTRERYCRQCGKRFSYTRDDQQFCSPACTAKFYRDNPNPPYIHAANYDEYWHTCEHCGVSFFVNGYAERGGKRAPKYHSVACKQAAYRARGKATQEQAARRQQQHTPPPHPPRQQQHTPPPPPPPPSDLPRWRYVGSSRYDTMACAEARSILDLTHNVSLIALRKAYRSKIAEWHPDRNPSPNATAWAQAINWAFDYLKTH